MQIIKITEDTLEKVEEDVKYDDSLFETDKEIEVRIPIEGYFTLKVKCKDAQAAMAEVYKAHKNVGILSLVGGDFVYGDVIEEDICAVEV